MDKKYGVIVAKELLYIIKSIPVNEAFYNKPKVKIKNLPWMDLYKEAVDRVAKYIEELENGKA